MASTTPAHPARPSLRGLDSVDASRDGASARARGDGTPSPARGGGPGWGRARLAVAVLTSAVLAGCPGGPAPYRLIADELDEGLFSVSGRAANDVWVVGSDAGAGPAARHAAAVAGPTPPRAKTQAPGARAHSVSAARPAGILLPIGLPGCAVVGAKTGANRV